MGMLATIDGLDFPTGTDIWPFAGNEKDWTLPKIPVSTRKVGGIRFIKVWKLCFSICITKEYKSL